MMTRTVSFLTIILTATCLAPSVAQAQNSTIPSVDCNSCWLRILGPGEYSLDGGNSFELIPENGRIYSRCEERTITVRSTSTETHFYPAAPRCCNRDGTPAWRLADEELWEDQDAQNGELRRLANIDGMQDNRADQMARNIQQNSRDITDHTHPPIEASLHDASQNKRLVLRRMRDEEHDHDLDALQATDLGRRPFQGALTFSGFTILTSELELHSGPMIGVELGVRRVRFRAGLGVDVISLGLALNLGLTVNLVDGTGSRGGNMHTFSLAVDGFSLWTENLTRETLEGTSQVLGLTAGPSYNFRRNSFSLSVGLEVGVCHRQSATNSHTGVCGLGTFSINWEWGEFQTRSRQSEERGE